jgi:hypothetical protein
MCSRGMQSTSSHFSIGTSERGTALPPPPQLYLHLHQHHPSPTVHLRDFLSDVYGRWKAATSKGGTASARGEGLYWLVNKFGGWEVGSSEEFGSASNCGG